MPDIQTTTANNEDDLTVIRFTFLVEADLSEGQVDELLGKDETICHVHAALRKGPHADVTVEPGAF